MSQKLKANITCPYCGNIHKMELYRSIWGEFPENKELVLSDKINVAHCPYCHKDTKLIFSLLYTNTPKRIAVWWEPEFDLNVEEDQKKYKKVLPNSHLAKAPRIRDWEDFKTKIIELENKNMTDYSKDELFKDIFNTQIENKTSLSIDIKLTLVSIFFLICTLFDYKKCRYSDNFCFNFPYGFYTILRFVIFGYFLYCANLIFKKSKISFAFIVSCLFAIIYNPFVKISFEKDIWHGINLVTIFVIIFFAKSEFIKFYNNYISKK